MKVRKAIIPAAGLGKRFLPATIEYALQREDLRYGLLDYLSKVVQKELVQ